MSERAKIGAAWGALAFIWGSTYFAIQVGVAVFPAFGMAGTRFLLAGLALTGIAKMRGAAFPKEATEIGRLAVIGLLLLVGANGMVTFAEQTLPSGFTALMCSTAPLLTGIFALASPHSERLRARGWLGLALGFLGLAILLHPTGGARLPLFPVGLLLFSTTCWATGSTLSRRWPLRCDPMAGTGVEMLMGSVALLGLSAALEHGLKGPVTWPSLLAVAYLTVAGSCIAFTVFFWLLKRLPAARATTYAYVNPIVALLLGWAFLRERITAMELAGAAVTLGGVFMANTGRAPIQEPAAREPIPVPAGEE